MKRMHIHVGVNSMADSINFYSTLFGSSPTTQKDDYAKWMLDDPKLNFAISKGHIAHAGIEHIGIQVDSEAELLETRARLSAAESVNSFVEEDSKCCYANSEKTWAVDPQNVIWESFYTMDDMQTYGARPEVSDITASPKT